MDQARDAMTEEEALERLDSAIRDTYELEKEPRSHTDKHARWIVNTSYLLHEIFGPRSGIYQTFQMLTYGAKPGMIIEGVFLNEARDNLNRKCYLEDLGIARGCLQAGIDVIKRNGIKSVYETGDPVKESNLIVHILSAIRSNLRKSIREVPSNERTIQDSLETIFNVKGFEFLRESEHIQYSSKTYVPDFTFPSINATVEVKLCNVTRKEKDLIGEINDDILAYSAKYSNLIFIVYDVTVIRDIEKFTSGFSNHPNAFVEVIKH
jgi:hypothetical protein